MAPIGTSETSTAVNAIYRQIVDEANDSILLIGKDGTVLYANPATRKLLGYSPEGPFPLHADELFRGTGDTWQSWLAHRGATRSFREERKVSRTDGSIFFAEMRWSDFAEDRTLLFMQDITHRKQEEEARDAKQQLYQVIADNLPNAMTFVIDRDLRCRYCAGPELRQLGWSKDFLLGKQVRDVIPPEQVAIVEEYCQRSFKGETATYQVQVSGKDYSVSSAPLSFSGNIVDNILLIALNVTLQMQAQREREASEERYRNIFQNSHAVMLLVDVLTGDIVDANAAAIRFYGWPLTTLRSMHIADLIVGSPLTTLTAISGARTRVSSMFHIRHRVASGEIKDVEVYTGPIVLRGRPHLLSIIHDASARYEAEQALEESEARYRTLFEQAGDAILLMDEMVIVDCNAKSLEFFKADRETLLGKTMVDLLTEQQPDGLLSTDKLRSFLGRAMKGETLSCPCVCCRTDGTTFDAEVTLSSFAVPGRAFALALIRDVTERNTIERELARSLEEKVTLLREIHHRVKNNMQVVSSLLNLQSAAVQSEEARNALRDSQDRIRSMALIHEKLYGTDDLSAVMMDAYVRELIAYLSRSYGRPEITVTSNLEEIKLKVDRAIPCGLILNELLTNALKHAFPDNRQGSVVISCKREEEHSLILTVADDGIGLAEGINAETASSLGLLLVKILAEQLGGTVTVDRTVGTTFRVRFPI